MLGLRKLSHIFCYVTFVALLQNNLVHSVIKISITKTENPDSVQTSTTAPSPPILATLGPLTGNTALESYCDPSLCEFYNGTHINIMPHIACQNIGTFGPTCGEKPHLLYMSERRRNLILDMHNLARSRIAAGLVSGFKSASHMPLLKWDNELEYMATLHVKRCQFAHDLCRNTPRYQFSGQNIGHYWIGRAFKSHSKRMKMFVASWFKEYKDANQTFVDQWHPHPEGDDIFRRL